jgi:hypothetical protein
MDRSVDDGTLLWRWYSGSKWLQRELVHLPTHTCLTLSGDSSSVAQSRSGTLWLLARASSEQWLRIPHRCAGDLRPRNCWCPQIRAVTLFARHEATSCLAVLPLSSLRALFSTPANTSCRPKGIGTFDVVKVCSSLRPLQPLALARTGAIDCVDLRPAPPNAMLQLYFLPRPLLPILVPCKAWSNAQHCSRCPPCPDALVPDALTGT